MDSEFDYGVVENFFNENIRPYFIDMSLYDDFAGQHPSTFLTKKLTDMGCESWGWEGDQFRDEELQEAYVIAAVLIHGEVFAYGKGASTKTARVAAAEEALKKMDAMDDKAFEKLCWCKAKNVVTEAVRISAERRAAAN